MSKKILQKKLNDLITLMMTDGVQPSELADNIFLDSYSKINFAKINGNIIGEISFEEHINEIVQTTTLRYFYDADRRIYQIEEEVMGYKTILWDRNIKEAEMINEIVRIMKVQYVPSQIDKFINTLPVSLSEKINKVYNVIAS